MLTYRMKVVRWASGNFISVILHFDLGPISSGVGTEISGRVSMCCNPFNIEIDYRDAASRRPG